MKKQIQIDDIAAAYQSGATLHDLEVKFGIPEETLRRHMKAAGVQMRPRGQPVGKFLPNGGKTVDKSGYILVKAPAGHPRANSCGYIREHRLVIEAHIGRELLPCETVHHLNGDKADNRIENLKLYATHAEHKRDELYGNTYAAGNKRTHEMPRRTDDEVIGLLRELATTLQREIRRVDLRPPYPCYSVLNHRFGHWSKAIDIALGRHRVPGP